MSPTHEPSRPLRDLLAQLGRRMRWAALLRGGSVWTVTTLGVWLAAFWADNLLRLPSGLRLPLVLGAVAWSLASAWRQVVPVWRRSTPERAARELEARCGVDDNLLISACQFETAGTTAWTAGMVGAARGRAATVEAEVVWNPAALRRGAIWVAVLAGLWLVYVAAWPHRAGNAWARLSRPLSDAPPLGTVTIATVPASDVALYEGDDLRIEAVLSGERYDPPPLLRRGPARGGAALAASEPMVAVEGAAHRYATELRGVKESFVFSVAAGGTWSRPVRVSVQALPRVVESTFRVTPPAYLGLAAIERAGVPQSLAGPTGSVARLSLRLAPDVAAAAWQVNGEPVALAKSGGTWQGETRLVRDGSYVVEAAMGAGARTVRVAEGVVFVAPDSAPRVAIEGVEANRVVWPGDELALEVVVSDEGGVRQVWLEGRSPDGGGASAGELRRWTYAGPPGLRGEVRERWTLRVDPVRFPPGETVVVEACAQDFNPAGAVARSLPLVLRVADPRAVTPGAASDPLADALSKAVEAQRRALGLTRNVRLHLEEALQEASLPRHAKSMDEAQALAQRHGLAALAAMGDAAREADARRLGTLVRNEMAWALAAVRELATKSADVLPARLDALAERQFHILNELLALLGQIRARAAERSGAAGALPPPAATLPDAARALQDALKDFVEVQKRVVKETLPLGRKGPEDLTDEEEDILGRLAREEERQAAFLKDAVDDFSKLPLQDFADGSLADEFHTVYQEVEKAAAALYEKKIELAVPLEQSGLEMAEELVHNLEKWLSDMPDYRKWLMEEPPDMPLPPMAELPTELEDIVGELLDEEQAMTEEIEDVTSSWNDSLDKGAGWDVADGPISDMSAKAVTGNLLPNQMEIGGRAGEGRSGRSHGQMVESEAVGKGGRQTPTRLTPSPFESGSVKDQSTEDPGGSTGGGKLSGFAGQGLRGPAPAARLDKMARLEGKQAEIRQDAERLGLHLRAWQAPSGDLDMAVAAMRRVEAGARAGKGGEIRQAYHEALDAMRDVRTSVAAAAAVRREQAPLGRSQSEELWSSLRELMPAGYEEMAAAYFRRLAVENGAP